MLELQKDLIPTACSDGCKVRQGIWSLCMLVGLRSCRTKASVRQAITGAGFLLTCHLLAGLSWNRR